MKIKSLFLGLLACIGLAACSSEDAVDNTVGKDFKGTAYMNVNLVFPGQGSSRATGSFEDGDANENTVSKVLFLFFRDDTYCGVTPIVETPKTTDPTLSGSKIDNIYGTVTLTLNLNKIKPNQVVAILNPQSLSFFSSSNDVDNDIKSHFNNKSLDEVRENITSSYCTGSNTDFVMTSSAYFSDDNANNKLYASTIADGQIYNSKESADAASATSVKIPVERIVAKVETACSVSQEVMDVKSGTTQKKITIIDINSTKNGIQSISNVEVGFTYKGFNVAYDNPESYLIKDIENSTITGFSWSAWNDANNTRSYWGNSCTPSENTSSNYHNNYLIYAPGDNTIKYCFGNTDQDNKPTLVVNGKLSLTAGSASFVTIATDGTVSQSTDYSGSIYRWRGTYYTENGLKMQFAIAASTNTTTYDYSKITFTKKANEASKADILYDGNAQDSTTDLGRLIFAVGDNIIYWNSGATYYYTPIVTYAANNSTSLNGLIRNSVYKITVSTVAGLGTAIADQSDPIVPTAPEAAEEAYIKAEIQVLAWRVNEQSVNLGE